MENIKVYIRPRPLNENERDFEIQKGYTCTDGKTITMGDNIFEFDQVFNEAINQSQIFDAVIEPIIKDVFLGYDYTVLTFGQKESGKTHTMMGSFNPYVKVQGDGGIITGIIPRSILNIFKTLDHLDKDNYSVRVSYLEIYNEEVTDLLDFENDLDPLKEITKCTNKEKVLLENVKIYTVTKTTKVYELLKQGLIRKEEQEKLLKKDNSRSHIIFTIMINKKDEDSITTNSLTFVDLSRTEYINEKESTLNKSILTLSKILKAWTKKECYIPYKESILTRILQDSLGGKTRATMIANVIPSIDFYNETLSTLEYAQMARKIKNISILKLSYNIANESQMKLLVDYETLFNNLNVEKAALLYKLSQRQTNVVNELNRLYKHINVLKEELSNFNKERLRIETDGRVFVKIIDNIFKDTYLEYLVTRSRVVNYFRGKEIYEVKYNKRKFISEGIKAIRRHKQRNLKYLVERLFEIIQIVDCLTQIEKYIPDKLNLKETIFNLHAVFKSNIQYVNTAAAEFKVIKDFKPDTMSINCLIDFPVSYISHYYLRGKNMGNHYNCLMASLKKRTSEMSNKILKLRNKTLPKIKQQGTQTVYDRCNILTSLKSLENKIEEDCSNDADDDDKFKKLCPNVAQEHSKETSDLLATVKDAYKKLLEVEFNKYEEKVENAFKKAEVEHSLFTNEIISKVENDLAIFNKFIGVSDIKYSSARKNLDRTQQNFEIMLSRNNEYLNSLRIVHSFELNNISEECKLVMNELIKACIAIDDLRKTNSDLISSTKLEHFKGLNFILDVSIRCLNGLYPNDDGIKKLFIKRNLNERHREWKIEPETTREEVEPERKQRQRKANEKKAETTREQVEREKAETTREEVKPKRKQRQRKANEKKAETTREEVILETQV